MFKTKIINLATRPDRWEHITGELARFGITNYERFEACTGKGGPDMYGFNNSVHFALENEQELLLLEDDCVFLGVVEDLRLAKEKLPDDWDLLYLGANVRSYQKNYAEGIWHCDDAWTSHAILYSTKGARFVYENFPYDGTMIYDEWLRRQELKKFIMKPMIAIQKLGDRSDIFNGAIAEYGIKGTERFLQ